MAGVDPEFPSSAALRALEVDTELSPLVRRTFSLVSLGDHNAASSNASSDGPVSNGSASTEAVNGDVSTEEKTVLRTEYKATTNRMLRVSVNGFFESMAMVLGVMQYLDVDVLPAQQSQAEA
ncbi:MAG: hypothetical protein L6R37_000967 [Teloschistes peruensis]|nr:MAG: hypothetical protein L6R37_000967 [Teloschistes peruensis]